MKRLEILCGVAVVMLAAGCGPSADERLTCHDLLPVKDASFASIAAIVVAPGGKGCSACHNTDSPVYGYNFEGPGVAYDAMHSKIHIVYAQVASGTMPLDGEPWNDSDLRLLRSWYCYGAVYEADDN